MDTFPLGTQKITLAQCHYNEHTDLCKSIDLTENGIQNLDNSNMHYICDYYKSSLPASGNNDDITSWTLEPTNDKLYINGQSEVIQAVPNVENPTPCEWHLFVDGTEYSLNEVSEYLEVSIDSINYTLTIKAINKDLAKYIIKVEIHDADRTYYAFTEMEVCI